MASTVDPLQDDLDELELEWTSWEKVWDESTVWETVAQEKGVRFPSRETARLLLTYLPPILLIVGTVGNILTATLMWIFHRRVLSTCLYMFAVEIVELVSLYAACGNDWLYAMAHVNVRRISMHSSKSLCKIHPFITDLVVHLGTWLTVAMATETAVVTLKPSRLMRLCRVERARAVSLLLVVLLVCVNAHCFWSWALITEDRSTQTITTCTTQRVGHQHSEEFRKVAWPIINILVSDFFPLFILFSSLVIVVTKRVRRKEHLQELENAWKAYSVDAKAARELHSAFIGILVFYVIMRLPKLGYEIYSFLVDPEHMELIQPSLHGDARRILARTVCYLLVYTYQSCSFFIYLASCRAFRRGVWSMLTCTSCSAGLDPMVYTPSRPPVVVQNDYQRSAAASTERLAPSPNTALLVPDTYMTIAKPGIRNSTEEYIMRGDVDNDVYSVRGNTSPRKTYSTTAV